MPSSDNEEDLPLVSSDDDIDDGLRRYEAPRKQFRVVFFSPTDDDTCYLVPKVQVTNKNIVGYLDAQNRRYNVVQTLKEQPTGLLRREEGAFVSLVDVLDSLKSTYVSTGYLPFWDDMSKSEKLKRITLADVNAEKDNAKSLIKYAKPVSASDQVYWKKDNMYKVHVYHKRLGLPTYSVSADADKFVDVPFIYHLPRKPYNFHGLLSKDNVTLITPKAVMLEAIFRFRFLLSPIQLPGPENYQIASITSLLIAAPGLPRGFIFPPVVGNAIDLSGETLAATYMGKRMGIKPRIVKELLTYICPGNWLSGIPLMLRSPTIFDESWLLGGSFLRVSLAYIQHAGNMGGSIQITRNTNRQLALALAAAAPYANAKVYVAADVESDFLAYVQGPFIVKAHDESNQVLPLTPYEALDTDVVLQQLLVLSFSKVFTRRFGSITGAMEALQGMQFEKSGDDSSAAIVKAITHVLGNSSGGSRPPTFYF